MNKKELKRIAREMMKDFKGFDFEKTDRLIMKEAIAEGFISTKKKEKVM